MSIFGKHIFRSIKKEPAQPIVIILILSLCVAVLLLSVVLPLNIYRDSRERLKTDEWSDDMTVSLKATSDVRLLFEEDIAEALGERGEVLGEFALSGFFMPRGGEDRVLVEFGAFDLTRADEFYEIRYAEYGKFTSQNLSRAVILQEGFAAEHGIALGDTISINVLGRRLDLVVEAIAKQTGFFLHSEMMVDISSVREELASRSPLIASLSSDFNPYTKIHIKLSEGYDPTAVKSELEGLDVFEDKVVELVVDGVAGDYMTRLLIVTTLMPAFLLAMVAAMMMISSLNLLQKKRREDTVLFKMVGADSSHLNRLVYLESAIYAVIGGVFGSLLSLPAMEWLNHNYQFTASKIRFGMLEAMIGMGASLIFTFLCTRSHIRRQRKRSIDEELSGENLDTGRHFSLKRLLVAIPLLVLMPIIWLLPATKRYVPAFGAAASIVLLICVMAPYIIGWVATLISFLLSKNRRGLGVWIPAARSCSNSYPLRHAGRIMTVLLTIGMSTVFILGAVEGQVSAYIDFAKFDYLGYEVDDETIEMMEQMDGVVAISQAYIDRNVVIRGHMSTHGMAIVGDREECFDVRGLSERVPKGNELILSLGIARMYQLEIGDRVPCEISGIECELVLVDIIDHYGDYAFYDAEYVGVPLKMTCIVTDGTQGAQERLLSLFNERGVNYVDKAEFFDDINESALAHIKVIRAMLGVMIVLSVAGVCNVLAEQRIARRREFEILLQNGGTKRGIVGLQAAEMVYILVAAILVSVVCACLICRVMNYAAVSFGLTLFA